LQQPSWRPAFHHDGFAAQQSKHVQIGGRQHRRVDAIDDLDGWHRAPGDQIDIYYRKPVNTTAPVHPIPIGLRMRVGDAMNTTKPGAALWPCGTGAFKSAIPPATCTAEVHESMYFPQCWNGTHLDAPDHHTLVGCTGAPDEIRLPQIQLIAHFAPGSGGGRLESYVDVGTSGGRTAHDDYWFAGDPVVWAKYDRRGGETHAKRRHAKRSRRSRSERRRTRGCPRQREARPVSVHHPIPLGHVMR
jgi:hypothetical protein